MDSEGNVLQILSKDIDITKSFQPGTIQQVEAFPNFILNLVYLQITSENFEVTTSTIAFMPFISFSITKENDIIFLSLCSQKQIVILEVNDERKLQSIRPWFEQAVIVPSKSGDQEFLNSILPDTSKLKYLEESQISDSIYEAKIMFDHFYPNGLTFGNELTLERILYLGALTLFSFFLRRNYFPTSSFSDPSFFTPVDEIKGKKMFLDSDLIKLRVIEYGDSSVISNVIHIPSGVMFAMKTYTNIQKYKAELACFDKLRHSRIVRCFGVTKQGVNKSFILEFMSNGSLDKIDIEDPTLKTKIVYQILFAVDYLHSIGIMHRDIKPSNVLLNRDFNAYVAGFSLAREFNSLQKRSRNIGTLNYMAPEIMRGSDSYSFQADLYSLGVLIYELSTGKNPFDGFCLFDIVRKNTSGQIDRLPLSQGTITKLFDQCISVEAQNRSASFYLAKMIEEENLFFANAQEDEVIPFIEKLKDEQKAKYQDVDQNQERTDVNFIFSEAANGNANAQYNLGAMYKYGWIVEKNFTTSLDWFTKAAKQGNSPAMYEVGLFYHKGIGVQTAPDIAVKYYHEAANSGLPDAMNGLGELFLDGIGVAIDNQEALDWFKKSADKGNHYAQCNLAKMYYSGKLGEPDFKKAFEYFNDSSSQGNAEAEYQLAKMYLEGKGVEKSDNLAATYFRKSAFHKRADAMREYGQMLIEGKGIQQNEAEGNDWIHKADEIEKQ